VRDSRADRKVGLLRLLLTFFLRGKVVWTGQQGGPKGWTGETLHITCSREFQERFFPALASP
jgi:hypothetical protein